MNEVGLDLTMTPRKFQYPPINRTAGKLAMAEPTRSHRDFAQYSSPNSVGRNTDMVVKEKKEKRNPRTVYSRQQLKEKRRGKRVMTGI